MSRGGPLAPLIKGVAAGMGLVSEGVAYYREQQTLKGKTEASSDQLSASNTGLPPKQITVHERENDASTAISKDDEDQAIEIVVEDDEQHWDLDDAQDNPTAGAADKSKGRRLEGDPATMTKHFIDTYPIPLGVELGRLSLPVVLPQRRPKNRTRGFIRAYAPELQQCGIDQAMFMDFLETFNQATLASPWLDAINLASLAFMALPTAISQAASIAVAIAVEITKNMQSRHRYNNVLDQMNNDFYRPRGLYALVLAWNPESDEMRVSVDLNKTIAETSTASQGVVQKIKHSLRPSMGNTVGVAFAETSPLVFPTLDRAAHEDQGWKQKVKNAKGFVGDYFDRRAQATYAGQHPESQLVVGPKPTFASRYSDPNHASSSGDLLALVTGGKLTLSQGTGPMGRRRNFVQGFASRRREMLTGGGPNLMGPGLGRQQGSQQQGYQNDYQRHQGPNLTHNGIKRIFQHHVLYLVIVNMPSDDELAMATQILSQAQPEQAV